MTRVDLHGLAAGIAAARGQSVDQTLSDLLAYGDRAVVDAFLATKPPPVGWSDAVAELGKLPSIDRLKEENSPVCARIATNGGCHLYAFSWEHIEPDLARFIGVHCLPGESVELERQQRFVITDGRGRAMIMLADAYLDALEHQQEAFVFDVFEVVLESAPNVPEA